MAEHPDSPFEELCWNDLLARNYDVIWGDKFVRASLRQRSSAPYPPTDPCCDFIGRHRYARAHYVLAEAKEGEDFDHALVQLGTAARHLRAILTPVDKIKFLIYVEKDKPDIRGYQLKSFYQDHGWDAGAHNILHNETAGKVGEKSVISPALPSWMDRPEGGLRQTRIIQGATVEIIYKPHMKSATPAQRDRAENMGPQQGSTQIFAR